MLLYRSSCGRVLLEPVPVLRSQSPRLIRTRHRREFGLQLSVNKSRNQRVKSTLTLGRHLDIDSIDFR